MDSIVGQVMKSSKDSSDLLKHRDSSAASSSSGLLTPTAGEPVVVGFEDDLTAIKHRLCGQSSKLQLVPIFGMGGIGKTTLARNAYDDQLIMEHFQIRAWVKVSQDYSIQEILSNLLVSIKPSNGNQCDEFLAENVYKGLKGMRYLIVIDDVWSTKAWDDIKMIFPDDNNGSRIIVTTRLLDIATYAQFSSSSAPHEMHFLDEDQSWNLLRQMVFKQEDCPVELEKIGKLIARSCGGLPLAIIVIAGLLSTVGRTQASWEDIAENVNVAVTTNYEQFAKILSLSYIHLPQHLRPCFLYMGGFPEDYEIHVWKLIKLWVAEGFIKSSESKSFEEEAEEYLEDLVKRSLVLVTKRKTNGKIKVCGVHDLVRDLCIRKAQEEKFLHRYVGKMLFENMKHQHRISIMHLNLNSLENIYSSTIHTIICFQASYRSPTHPEYCSFLGNFRMLKILDMVNSARVPFSPEVFELFHLRYLAVDYSIEIPATISNLQNLQTLIVHRGKIFKSYEPMMIFLPPKIWMIPQLRHLVSFVFGRLPDPERAISPLENLQTLSEVRDFRCTEKFLKMIPNLKKLSISYFRGKNDQEYQLNNLLHFHQLEKLKVKIFPTFLFRRKLNLAFPPSLKKLTLSGWQRPWEDMGIVSLLPNLEVLKLRDYAFRGYKWETSEEEFRCLKFLLLDKSDLQHWITESSHFPNLKCLVLYRCWCLKEIPDGFGEIPTLELIKVDDGNISLVDSARQIQEVQQGWGNDAFQVRVGRYNTLTGDIK
ncbi:putative late blight resistance protein homolog R1B-14 [Sesamum indicum]|uniref:Late blight resistance protein homolog R1B-14 n=1 Tax=Sesamum indicum TaxID=4182 RepID=A0A6I9T2F9_SESIN|nr:putative late blight resistance protein homolog R1B-14 [Sesamum indicum]XP_020548935.1 putative late blight resistance protein homolog R1B-14 [Sesamum indicum]